MSRPRRRRGVRPILAAFDSHAPLLTDFGPRAEALVRDILAASTVRPHTVTHRVKERHSLERKLNQPDKRYGSLDEVTDLLGVRVITYFDDDVDVAADALFPQFQIREIVDRRRSRDPRQFGYASLHAIARLGEERADWPEYRRFDACTFEIQIRSILQHAWAEIEHDLGYKTAEAVPYDLRHRFSRLAGLLELADEEFTGVRNAAREHAARSADAVSSHPTTTPIDQDSVIAFLHSSSRLAELDQELSRALGEDLEPVEEEYAGALAGYLSAAGITNIGELDPALADHADRLRRFSMALMTTDEPHPGPLPTGISIFHLIYVLLHARGPETIQPWAEAVGFRDPETIAQEILEVFEELDA